MRDVFYGAEITQFIKAGKLSNDSLKQIFVELATFERFPPLKTIEEIKRDNGKYESLKWRETKRELVNIIRAELSARRGENNSFAQVTPDQAYDMLRLFILESIFMKEGIRSEALEMLMDQVLDQIVHTIGV